MKLLHDDQIHAPAFQKISDYIWSDDIGREPKGGNWEYVLSVVREHNPNLGIINHTNMPHSGVIFVGMCHIIENVFRSIPNTGSYIIIHRPSDRSFTQAMYNMKPASVKHIYTVDCAVTSPDVSAIPFGLASINGEDNLIKTIVTEKIKPADTRVFCRYNTNPVTKHRNESISILKGKPFVKLLEQQIPADDFYREIKAHRFTMALAGCGMDASRQWAAMILGSIPIVTDCPEMRHFEDLPMAFCPADMNTITEEWLIEQEKQMAQKTTERMRMSYWENHLKEKRKQIWG